MIDDDRSAGDIQERLAANLRRLRIARHLSLSELARATGMSKATLSGIESGRSNPTVETLASLAAALRVAVVDLLGELPLGEVRVVRAEESAVAPGDGLLRRGIDEVDSGNRVEVSEIALEALEMRELEPRAQGARTSVYVIDGKLIAGPVERSTELGAGDYIRFPADVPHVLAAGRKRVRALLLAQSRE
jgi:transcriptional regulator with XRE-family HTH domain